MSTTQVFTKEFTNDLHSDFKITLSMECVYGKSDPPSFAASLPAEYLITFPNSS